MDPSRNQIPEPGDADLISFHQELSSSRADRVNRRARRIGGLFASSSSEEEETNAQPGPNRALPMDAMSTSIHLTDGHESREFARQALLLQFQGLFSRESFPGPEGDEITLQAIQFIVEEHRRLQLERARNTEHDRRIEAEQIRVENEIRQNEMLDLREELTRAFAETVEDMHETFLNRLFHVATPNAQGIFRTQEGYGTHVRTREGHFTHDGPHDPDPWECEQCGLLVPLGPNGVIRQCDAVYHCQICGCDGCGKRTQHCPMCGPHDCYSCERFNDFDSRAMKLESNLSSQLSSPLCNVAPPPGSIMFP